MFGRMRATEKGLRRMSKVRRAGGARACFIKCVARGKSARQFSGAKGSADNAGPHLKQSVTLFNSLFSAVSCTPTDLYLTYLDNDPSGLRGWRLIFPVLCFFSVVRVEIIVRLLARCCSLLANSFLLLF